MLANCTTNIPYLTQRCCNLTMGFLGTIPDQCTRTQYIDFYTCVVAFSEANTTYANANLSCKTWGGKKGATSEAASTVRLSKAYMVVAVATLSMAILTAV